MERTWVGRVFEQLKIVRKRIEFLQVPLLSNQQVLRFAVSARNLIQDVADVGSDSEIAGAPDIDRNTHRRLAGCAGTPCEGWCDFPAAVVERKLCRELRDFSAD